MEVLVTSFPQERHEPETHSARDATKRALQYEVVLYTGLNNAAALDGLVLEYAVIWILFIWRLRIAMTS